MGERLAAFRQLPKTAQEAGLDDCVGRGQPRSHSHCVPCRQHGVGTTCRHTTNNSVHRRHSTRYNSVHRRHRHKIDPDDNPVCCGSGNISWVHNDNTRDNPVYCGSGDTNGWVHINIRGNINNDTYNNTRAYSVNCQ